MDTFVVTLDTLKDDTIPIRNLASLLCQCIYENLSSVLHLLPYVYLKKEEERGEGQAQGKRKGQPKTGAFINEVIFNQEQFEKHLMFPYIILLLSFLCTF